MKKQLPYLDIDVILRILSLLPDDFKALTKRVCKAAYTHLQQYKHVSIRCPLVPLHDVKLMYKRKLLDRGPNYWYFHQDIQEEVSLCREAAGDRAGAAWVDRFTPWEHDACTRAAASGWLDVLEQLLAPEFALFSCQQYLVPLDVTRIAAEAGELEVLQFLRSHDPPYAWDSSIWPAAVRGRHSNMVQWLARLGPQLRPPMDEQACIAAAEGGHLGLLKWLRAQEPPCPWDADACTTAVRQKNTAMVKWMRSSCQPCPADATAWEMAIESDDWEMLCSLKCPHAEGQTVSNETYDEAAATGDLQLLEWLSRQPDPNGHLTSKRMCELAARFGQLEALMWLTAKDPPCILSANCCNLAAGRGHLEVLRWLWQQGPPCDITACTHQAALAGGHKHVLRWLRGKVS